MTPLGAKLRYPQSGSVTVLNPPDGYLECHGAEASGAGPFDFVQLFAGSVDELARLGPEAIRSLRPGGTFWLTFPKGGKTVGATDLPASPWWRRRDVFGQITGVRGCVPIAQVSIDDRWTALRFRVGD